ncbi:hypothetical protein [Cryptosporangium japonicum]|uniref:hypothetical protein n=1 Tax=Cryptosporangium japonicum TaxID=80872 RepID=UPI0031D8590E
MSDLDPALLDQTARESLGGAENGRYLRHGEVPLARRVGRSTHGTADGVQVFPLPRASLATL